MCTYFILPHCTYILWEYLIVCSLLYFKSLYEAFITYCGNSYSAIAFKACYIIAGQLLTSTQQPNDMTYEDVPGPAHCNDSCQPIPLESNEAYSVHQSGNAGKPCPQEVDLKSNEAYGVRGEVQESNLEDEAN